MSKARMSDIAVQAKTGKNWQQWFAILDRADTMKMSHKEMAAYTCMISTGCRAGDAR
jgi:cephalosporin hydroxylase